MPSVIHALLAKRLGLPATASADALCRAAMGRIRSEELRAALAKRLRLPRTASKDQIVRAAFAKMDAGNYNEADHKRADDGKWTSGGGGSGSAAPAKKKATWAPAQTSPVSKGEGGKLKKNADGKGPDDRVFDVAPDRVAGALPKGVKVKDLRTLVATTDAERQLSGITPKMTGNDKADARAIIGHLKTVSTAVSKQLNNTPAMARRSYIAPQVIRAWGEKHGIKPEWLA